MINSDKEFYIVCRLLYYNISEFYLNVKKLLEVYQEEGYQRFKL